MLSSTTYLVVEDTEGDFAQLMALFAVWRADIDAEPFAYSENDLLGHWRRPECVRLDRRTWLTFAPCPPAAAGSRPSAPR